ncbi:interferon-induced protein with tetratricopeptide repeats 1-like [Eucyclogobius newberryi]|uniref:interferon-induced protein with tetratricopeptide repeats 1-like n=1 Tax=Eucyclogobius newberryi TaxID=166745 RepID=UPI003B5C27C5
MSGCSSDSAHSGALLSLQCHFTWELHHSKNVQFFVRDRLEDFLPQSTSWRGENYNLQGFLQAGLGHFSEALSRFHSASETLTGPGRLVNYSDLAWLHHERGEQEQSQEYLSRVEKLSRKYPTEVDQPHPTVLAEKAFSLMQFNNDRKLLAVELFEEALKKQPERVEWLSAQAIALVSAKRYSQYSMHKEVLSKMRRARDRDPDNVRLCAEYLYQKVWRKQNVCTEEQQREATALVAQLLENPVRTYRVEAAVDLAEKALQKLPDSRYLKSCLAMCLKWQMDQQRESASQELIERTAALLGEVISLYPDSCFRTEIDLANVLAKSNHSLTQADRLYQDLLQRDLDPASKQMLYNNYAKFLKLYKKNHVASIEYHMRAAAIPVHEQVRVNSITQLQRIHSPNSQVEAFLRNIQEPP